MKSLAVDTNRDIGGALACEVRDGSKISGRELFCANEDYREIFEPELGCNKPPGLGRDNGGVGNCIRRMDLPAFFLEGEVEKERSVVPKRDPICARLHELFDESLECQVCN